MNDYYDVSAPIPYVNKSIENLQNATGESIPALPEAPTAEDVQAVAKAVRRAGHVSPAANQKAKGILDSLGVRQTNESMASRRGRR